MTGTRPPERPRPSGMWPSTRPSPPGPPTRWSRVRSGPDAARAYRQHFLDLAAEGRDLHGEARFVTALVPPKIAGQLRKQLPDAAGGPC